MTTKEQVVLDKVRRLKERNREIVEALEEVLKIANKHDSIWTLFSHLEQVLANNKEK